MVRLKLLDVINKTSNPAKNTLLKILILSAFIVTPKASAHLSNIRESVKKNPQKKEYKKNWLLSKEKITHKSEARNINVNIKSSAEIVKKYTK